MIDCGQQIEGGKRDDSDIQGSRKALVTRRPSEGRDSEKNRGWTWLGPVAFNGQWSSQMECSTTTQKSGSGTGKQARIRIQRTEWGGKRQVQREHVSIFLNDQIFQNIPEEMGVQVFRMLTRNFK